MSVESIFAVAAQKPSSERIDYLANACGNDAELRRQVERLLAAHDAAGEFLESPAYRPAGTVDYVPITEKPGTRIGPYKLMEQIGEGGFGLVFVAEQQEPVKRKVALKVIKPGMDSAQVIARFEAERQALALMDHPNIARVLDAGATGSGLPYFVMELVRGIPITDYCDQNQLSPLERLDLFIAVCQAIQHAHQKGIIHRDIKPSNLLVMSHDGKPVAKVIDFGVAKAINQQLTERTIYTNFAQMIGTPLYMSPEQAEMSGLDIDTRSDIYSLGVLLYELLTGTTPLEKKQLREAAYDEIRRLIREEEPPKPSTRLSTSDSIASIAAQRHTDPAKLSKLMRGDLDWITMKALEKDRTRRYDTANGLARDLQRYLADEVVEARPPSVGYRLRKYVRRHRVALTTVFVFVVTLKATTLFSIWQASRAFIAETIAEQERDEAARQRDAALAAQRKAEAAAGAERAAKKVADAERAKAQKQADIAQAVQKFLEEDLIDQADVSRAAANGPKPDPEIKLKTAIDRAAGKIPERFAGQPLTEASVRAAIGRAYVSLGLFGDARPHLELARSLCWTEIARNNVAEPDADVASEILNYASARLASVEAARGHDDIAAQLLRESKLPVAKALVPVMDFAAGKDLTPEMDRGLEILGQAVDNLTQLFYFIPEVAEFADRRQLFSLTGPSRYPKEEVVLRRMIDRRRRAGKPSRELFVFMTQLADVYFKQGKTAEAEETYAAARDGFKKLLGESHPITAVCDMSLGQIFSTEGEYDRAEKVLRPALATFQRQLSGSLHQFQAQSALGAALLHQKKYAEAEPLLRAAYEGVKENSWPIIPMGNDLLVDTSGRLVQLYEATNRPDEAAKWRKELEALKPPAKP
jgi:serine/threonine protein kinase/tetratricopeptide (TPR) repeat protein